MSDWGGKNTARGGSVARFAISGCDVAAVGLRSGALEHQEDLMGQIYM
jgi:hypothetical protein